MERFFNHFGHDTAPVPPASQSELERCRRRLGAPLPDPLEQFLRRCNGGYFGGGLVHVMGACRPLRHEDLVTWNQPYDWKSAYIDCDLGRYIFFADDVFGNQFGYVPGEANPAVWRFDIQVGELMEIAPTVTAFFDQVLVDDGEWMLGGDYLQAYKATGAALQAGDQLSLIIPSLLGGTMEPTNLRPVDAATNLYLAGQLLGQLRNPRPLSS